MRDTPESLSALNHLNFSSVSPKTANLVRKELAHPEVFVPRSKPKTSRNEFLEAFNALLNGDSNLFLDLVAKVPDGEKDVVATLTQADLPLLRKVRRRMIAGGNQHSIEFYESFTKIIRTIMLNSPSSNPPR